MYEKYVEVDRRRVRYKVAGSGKPVVLVHGLAGSMRWWTTTIPALAAQYQVYLVDLPGFGSMRDFPSGFVLEEAASWLLAWMKEVGLQRVHLVGHSMGALICAHAAAQEPQAVDCLVLVDAAGVPTNRAVLEHIWPLMQECLFSSPSFLPILLYDSLRAGPLTLWRAAMAVLTHDVRDDLRLIKAPTLIIWGEKDALVPPSVGYVLRQEIAHSRLIIIKGSRHVPMMDKPRALNRALLSFFAGHSVGE